MDGPQRGHIPTTLLDPVGLGSSLGVNGSSGEEEEEQKKEMNECVSEGGVEVENAGTLGGCAGGAAVTVKGDKSRVTI